MWQYCFRVKLRSYVVFVILVAFCVFLPKTVSALSDEGYRELHNFAKVLQFIEENYVKKIDEKKVLQGAIRGLMDDLDPYSVYMSPEIYRELKVDTKGRFDGIGIEVSVNKNGSLIVVSPIKGSPADEAGIQARDRIVRINGKPTSGLNLSEAVSRMRGKRGSKITLSVLREGQKKAFDVTITRKIIKVPSVKGSYFEPGIGYVNIINFQQGTARAVEKAIKEMTKGTGKEMPIDGLIIDLRKNPGGLLDQAIEVSDLFLESGTIVSTETRGKEIDRVDAKVEGTQPNYPIILLVDEGSASASEIVAGALQDNGRALVMGTNSFGKGSVQTVIDLDDGAGLKLTIARYLTPSGKSIQDNGIKPDIIVYSSPEKELAMAKKEEKGAKKSEKAEAVVEKKEKEDEKKEGPKRDYQLEKALEQMKLMIANRKNNIKANNSVKLNNNKS